MGAHNEHVSTKAATRRGVREGTAETKSHPSEPLATRAVKRIAILVAPWAVLVVLWYLVYMSGMVKPGLLPTPLEVVKVFVGLFIDNQLYVDMYMSTQRVFIGVVLGSMCALPIGFVLGWYQGLGRFLDPLINFFRALPPIALIPLVIIYFGIGETAKIVILFYAAFFASVIVMYEGISQISSLYIRVARTLGATDMEIFWRVIVPMSIPHMLTALRVALGVAWATLVASELVAAQRGLGAVIQDASHFFQLDIIYMGIICIGFIALAMDFALRALSNRILRWQE